jgi:hypothetical protein
VAGEPRRRRSVAPSSRTAEPAAAGAAPAIGDRGSPRTATSVKSAHHAPALSRLSRTASDEPSATRPASASVNSTRWAASSSPPPA